MCKDDTDLNEERVKKNISKRHKEKADTVKLEGAVNFMRRSTMHNDYSKESRVIMTKQLIKTATYVMDQVRQKVKVSLRDAFDTFDEDDSGTISHNELAVAITKVSGRSLNRNESAAIIAMFDPNGDGR